jgi:DNA polymerase III alpha subunit
MDIRILPADVNISAPSWTIDNKKNAIRRGLSSIKGIGVSTAESIAANAPYESLEDLIEKNPARAVSGAPKYLKEGEWTGNLKVLRDAGALGSLGIGRDDD